MATMLRELSRRECEDLLRAGTVIRVAFVAPDGPHIVPVNYVLSGDAIVLLTSSSSLLGAFGAGSLLALEIDGFDTTWEQGWSVVVRGRGEATDDAWGMRSLRQPRPWILGRRTRLLRVPLTEVSGRRTGSGWSVVSPSPASGWWVNLVTPPELDRGLLLSPRARRRRLW